LTLRRQGRFISLAKAKRRRRPSPIPKTIVQFWDQQTPPSDVLALNESWRELNPGFTYRRFDSQDARAYLQEKASADIVAAYDRGSEPAMKADIFRLAVLYFDGGYYADADDRCIAPLKTITPGGCDLVLFQEEFGTIGNNLMAAAPANEVIGHALKSGVAAVNRGDHDMIWLATGPGLITRSLAETLAIGPAMLPQSLDRVQILQRSELISTVAIHCSTAYKQTRRHWSRSVYSIRSARNNAAEALPSSTEAG